MSIIKENGEVKFFEKDPDLDHYDFLDPCNPDFHAMKSPIFTKIG